MKSLRYIRSCLKFIKLFFFGSVRVVKRIENDPKAGTSRYGQSPTRSDLLNTILNFKQALIVVIGIIFIFSSCKKDKEEPSIIPKIEFISISPGTVKEYQDSINIVISYEDANGDIGENNAAVKNLFVTDSRNNVTYEYRISQLSPSGSNIHIKGNLNTIIKNTAITNGSNSQTVSYSIYLKDRAGNQSNTVSTSAITVNK